MPNDVMSRFSTPDADDASSKEKRSVSPRTIYICLILLLISGALITGKMISTSLVEEHEEEEDPLFQKL